MAEIRPLKKPRLDYSETIEVLVRPEKKRFTVHKDEICARSDFFKAACSERWQGSSKKSKAIELPEDSPQIFNIYLRCLYKNEVDVGDIDEPFSDEEDIPLDSRERGRVVKAYVPADRIQDIDAANQLMDEYDRCDMDGPDENPLAVEVISFIVNNTTATSPLRKLLLVDLAECSSYKTIRQVCQSELIPKSFLGELILKKQLDRPNVWDQFEAEKNNAEGIDEKKEVRWEDTDEYKEGLRRAREGIGPHPDLCRYHQHDDKHPPCYLWKTKS